MAKTETRARTQILRPTFLKVSDVEHFLFGRPILHGKITKRDGTQVNQVVARFLVNPDNMDVPHIHYYTNCKKTAGRIATMLRTSWQPWNPEKPRARMSTYSFGKKESWYQEPCFSASWFTRLGKEKATTSKVTGAYGTYNVDPAEKATPYIWVNGSKMEVDKVNDVLVDINTNERTQEDILQQLGWHERRAAIELERTR